MTTHPSLCRMCTHSCPILVDVEDGRATAVRGDPDNDVYEGYSCVKGRAQPAFLSSPERLRRSMRRTAGGGFEAVGVDAALDDIARRLTATIDEHGPRSVALYMGTMAGTHPASVRMAFAFMRAIGSGMLFNPSTIDKPGKQIAPALHGRWMAPRQEWDRPEAALLIGVNPLITYKGLPKGHQSRWLRDAQARGMKLIVIDPRRSDIAKRADLFLQPRPGYDIEIVACVIRTIVRERLHDETFVEQNVAGFDELARAVEPFDPDTVARLADLDAADLVAAGRIYGSARRAYTWGGTGPNLSMADHGTLFEYLMLSLEALCGNYLREGERVPNPGTLTAARPAVAQARGPWPVHADDAERLRVRDLVATAAGCPTAALPDEILLDGPGQVRVLICSGGNPASAWPDELKTVDALRSLDLLVQVDPWMSQTARLADYVIAPKMPLEMAGSTVSLDAVAGAGLGAYSTPEAYGQFTPAIVDGPEDAELIEDWELFYGLAQRMGLVLELGGAPVVGASAPAGLDMVTKPSSAELVELLSIGSRVPFEEVAAHRHGASFPEPQVFVAPRHAGWSERLDVGNATMLAELADLQRSRSNASAAADDAFPFRLICRRVQHMYNSTVNDAATNHGRPYNPAFLHPDDLTELGLAPGDLVEITSTRATILGVAAADEALRPGLLSMTHGFGGLPDEEADVRSVGSNVDRLLHNDRAWDRYSGQPPMSNIPVAVRRAEEPSRRVGP